MKAKLKEKEVSGGQLEAKDLSIEKRTELYQEALRKFDEEGVKTYGLSVDVELVYSKKGIIPRLVLVDVLKNNKNNGKAEETKGEQAASE